MGSISHHITPLVINSLGGGDTHTSIPTFVDRSNSKKPALFNKIHANIHKQLYLVTHKILINKHENYQQQEIPSTVAIDM